MKWKIEQKEKKVLVIQLDNWLSGEETRLHQSDVLNAYKLDKAETDIQQILIGISVKVISNPNYPEAEPQEINYRYKGEEYIIIEGSPALSSRILRDLAHVKIFLEIEDEKQKERLIKMIEWHGKELGDFSDFYTKLKTSEIQDIEPDKKFANIIK